MYGAPEAGIVGIAEPLAALWIWEILHPNPKAVIASHLRNLPMHKD